MNPSFQVEIKKPCLVNFDSIKSDSSGTFCSVCQTTVVDFTKKSPEEIAQYFQGKRHQNTCGTFNSWDLKSDSRTNRLIVYLQNKRLKFLAFFIIGALALSGCRTRGKVRAANAFAHSAKKQIQSKAFK
ncbi:MAG: hypothetical protein V4677_03445 [Bacteroidota bacterium]